jgi:peroxiredoxin (alkyl hydroperoxide reductase subunit C)
MLTIGDRVPDVSLNATVSSDPSIAFRRVSPTDFRGRWLILFFWPMDFTFVCPTEIAEFGRRAADFTAQGASVLGCSIDSEYVHLAWRQSHPEIREIPFPMLADVQRRLSSDLGILHPELGVAMRATFIIDPEGVIRAVSVTDMNVGRSVSETLRALEALQTNELTPCEWRPGAATLKPPGHATSAAH